MEEEVKLLTDAELDSFSKDDAYQLYIQDIKQYPVLSGEVQKELAQHYLKYKDDKTKELLINSNLRLVVSVAWKYAYRISNLQILDIIQEGNMGLLRAIKTYDPEKGAFSTYATEWIKQSIRRGIADKDKTIRKPVHLEELIKKYRYLISEYEKKELAIPNDEVLCEKLQISMITLDNLRRVVKQDVVSLNSYVSKDQDMTLEETIPDKTDVILEVLDRLYQYDLVMVIKNILSPVQYYIIYSRFLANKRLILEELGQRLGLTRERVRQIQVTALKRIKPLMVGERVLYASLLKDIKAREGRYYDYINLEPITPEQIIRYYYCKDSFTKLEDTLYKLIYFSKYIIKDYEVYLNISKEEYESLLASLKEKMHIDKREEYLKYQKEILEDFGKNVLDVITRESVDRDELNLRRYLKSS